MSLPKVVIDAPVKEGWLEKQSRALKRWKKRWCVLQDCYLFTYADEQGYKLGKAPTEMIDLRKHLVCESTPTATHKTPKLTFQLRATTAGEEDFPLAALKEKELGPWIETLSKQIERVKVAMARPQQAQAQAQQSAAAASQ